MSLRLDTIKERLRSNMGPHWGWGTSIMSRFSFLFLAISDFSQDDRKGHIALSAFSTLSPTSSSEPNHYTTRSVPLERNTSFANHNIGSSFLPTVCEKLNQKSKEYEPSMPQPFGFTWKGSHQHLPTLAHDRIWYFSLCLGSFMTTRPKLISPIRQTSRL